MSTATNVISRSSGPEHLRPFDIRRDLPQVADLVELCFADTLDPDGARYLQHMRQAARNPSLLRLASAATDWSGIPISGYVWIEAGELVGNVSLIPYKIKNQRCYLIANVAVHPDYRRRGIARQLTLHAIEHARHKGAASTWLHVRDTNEPAMRLYDSLDFAERTRRTTWISQSQVPLSDLLTGITISPRRALHWYFQYNLLRQRYPDELSWHLPLNPQALRPGILGTLYRFFTNTYVLQWSALRIDTVIGVLAWQATHHHADSLWLSASPEHEDAAAYSLLLYARQHLSPRKKLALDYPAGRAGEAIRSAGFSEQQTLVWMEKPLN
jgi:ribosomal protein S18 acetylase RimI-like enzyme